MTSVSTSSANLCREAHPDTSSSATPSRRLRFTSFVTETLCLTSGRENRVFFGTKLFFVFATAPQRNLVYDHVVSIDKMQPKPEKIVVSGKGTHGISCEEAWPVCDYDTSAFPLLGICSKFFFCANKPTVKRYTEGVVFRASDIGCLTTSLYVGFTLDFSCVGLDFGDELSRHTAACFLGAGGHIFEDFSRKNWGFMSPFVINNSSLSRAGISRAVYDCVESNGLEPDDINGAFIVNYVGAPKDFSSNFRRFCDFFSKRVLKYMYERCTNFSNKKILSSHVEMSCIRIQSIVSISDDCTELHWRLRFHSEDIVEGSKKHDTVGVVVRSADVDRLGFKWLQRDFANGKVFISRGDGVTLVDFHSALVETISHLQKAFDNKLCVDIGALLRHSDSCVCRQHRVVKIKSWISNVFIGDSVVVDNERSGVYSGDARVGDLVVNLTCVCSDSLYVWRVNTRVKDVKPIAAILCSYTHFERMSVVDAGDDNKIFVQGRQTIRLDMNAYDFEARPFSIRGYEFERLCRKYGVVFTRSGNGFNTTYNFSDGTVVNVCNGSMEFVHVGVGSGSRSIRETSLAGDVRHNRDCLREIAGLLQRFDGAHSMPGNMDSVVSDLSVVVDDHDHGSGVVFQLIGCNDDDFPVGQCSVVSYTSDGVSMSLCIKRVEVVSTQLHVGDQ